MLVLLVTSMFVLAVKIQPVRASGTIYIRADGSVDPPSASISTLDGVTYTFRGDIFDETVVVERNNVVVDGAGHTLQGTGAADSNGIYLTGRTNVTITNMTVEYFYYGVCLDISSGNTISGNNITNNDFGVGLESSSSNTVSGNNVTNNIVGVRSYSMSGSTVSGNNIANNEIGVDLIYSSNSTVSGNNITNTYSYGVNLYSSSNSTVS
jgi:parallel beta-helix repeat protein